MIVGALLANIVDAGTDVLTLAEDMDFATFQRSRLARDEALWFAVRSLVPATLMWLRVYRESNPELFGFGAG